ncbi:sorbitol dehydrogenase-like [Ptychodera flava]|uniref:sorbitol dehydrogenase-like n=1 Tax=Ptychodera flava TaxID=63121 RepID=UPI00396A5E68
MSAGMCHSDVHKWKKPQKNPYIPGHEIAGSIHAIGDSALNPDGLAVGDKVAVYPWLGCGKCKHCYKGNPPWCSAPPLEKKALGIFANGGKMWHTPYRSRRTWFECNKADQSVGVIEI